jgi:CopG family nickel-responsive transcriptional regulator
LLENFDRLIGERGYSTRSEALRDLIRESLIQQKIDVESDTQLLGSLTLVYDHHASNLVQEMGEIQHRFHSLVLSVCTFTFLTTIVWKLSRCAVSR